MKGESDVLDVAPHSNLAPPSPEQEPIVVRSVRRTWPLPLGASDAVALMLSMVVGASVRIPLLGFREGPASIATSLLHELPYIPGFLVAMSAYGLYRRARRRMQATVFPDLGHFLHGLVAGGIVALVVSGLLHRWTAAPRLGWVEVTLMSAPAAVLLPLLRTLAAAILRQKGTVRSRVVVVGSGAVAEGVLKRLRRFPDIELLGIVDDGIERRANATGTVRRLGSLRDLPRACADHQANRVIVTFGSEHPEQLVEVLRRLPAAVTVSAVTRFYELVTWQSQIEDLHGLTLMDIPSARLGRLQRAAKRTLDIVVSTILLLALSPLLAAIALTVRCTSPGPVFFRQDRVGRGNALFRIVKFRTMTEDAHHQMHELRDRNEVDGPLFKLHIDPRVTRIGGFLRKSSLDEIPQLFNVLTGAMSLVGPRPFVPDESASIDGWAARRFEVRPGMTGLWQISGRNDLPFEELRQLDYAYVASWSLWWDLRIIWHTPSSALRGHGAY